MHRAWVDFATDGDPGGRPVDARRPVRFFAQDDRDDRDGPSVVLAPRDDELRTWDPYRP
ncbi:carboxylic ester hydrolase [Streptomyces badius]